MAAAPVRRRWAGRRRAQAGRAHDRRALAVLLAGTALLLGYLALVLSHTAPRRSGTNGVWLAGEVPGLAVRARTPVCQPGEVLPAGTAALRIPVRGPRGPASVTLRRAGAVLDRVRGELDTTPEPAQEGWLRAEIARPPRDLGGVEVCYAARSPLIVLRAAPPPDVGIARVGGVSTGTAIPIDYLQPGRSSWWTQAPTIARRLALGRGDWGGRWVVVLLALLVAGSLALAARVVLCTIVADRRVAGVAWTIAAVAAANAVAWSLITPAFQVPDEVSHVAYVQRIGETGGPPPNPHRTVLSREELVAMTATRYGSIAAPTIEASVWTGLQQRRLLDALHARPARRPTVDVGESEPEPPLYYALEAIPYRLARGATLLDRLALMRLLSALLAGVTALCAFLFVRESLPGRPWAWAVGGLGVAFTPMLGFVSGGVNPDALLFALSAALLLCLARAFRRGVDTRLVLSIGALLAAGLLVKVNCAGLVPGTLLGLALAARRTEGAWNGAVARAVGLALVVGVLPFAAVTALEALAWGRPFAVGRPRAPESHGGLGAHFSYLWQLFGPRLPGQVRHFARFPLYAYLFKTFVGAFGVIVVRFPAWAYRLAAAGFVLLGLLAARALAAERAQLRRRRGELAAYATLAGVLVALVALSTDLRRNAVEVMQGRYLLPLAALLAVLFALAARGAGERWGRAAGVAILLATVGWTLLGQLLTISFFYS